MATVLLTGMAMAGCGQVPHGGNPLGGSDKNGSSSGSTRQNQPGSGNTPSPKPDPYTIKTNLANPDAVKVDKVLQLGSTKGTLSSVSVTGKVLDHGKTKNVTLDGALNSDKTGWKASALLEPSGTYTIKTTGKRDDGKSEARTTTFKTANLSLDQQVYPSFAGTLSGSNVGVGTPVVLRFDIPVTDKATVEKHLHVTSSDGQKGSWHWYSDQEVHWRPESYWKPGTTVKATADLNSIPTGDGKYGQTNTSTSFTVGKSVITKVDLKSDIAKVYIDGKLARSIPVSGGNTDKTETTTRSGVSLLTEKQTNYRMTSQMIGLPKTGPQSYDLRVKYAMRITNSGEFLHSAPWNAAFFGKENESHGCVGMSNEDAGWLYKNAPSGSPVDVTGTKRPLEPGNGLTDWNADFKTYAEGSAL